MEKQSVPPDLFATGVQNLGASAGSKVGGGRYCLIRVLGRGGMGVVWLAQDERLGAEVALKFLPAQIRYDASALDDLRRETARSRKLTHPNIVRIHDLYEAPDEDAFISMEYIDGRNLADLRVDQAARVFSWDFLKPLVEQLCAGLEYAHSERTIHRDLKPGNLMLDSKGRLKLADFGIARTVSDTMSRNSLSQTSGTILYMSPQQMEGDVPRATDDIYALGATLYELLTGKPPFYTGNIMHQVRNISPRPMQERLTELEFTNDVPRDVEQVIMACLSKNAAHRPQSAAEVWRLIMGDKLKLLEVHHGLEARRTPTTSMSAVTPEASLLRKWRWVAAGALACGVGLWAVTHTSKRTAVKAKESVGTNAPAPIVFSGSNAAAPPIVTITARTVATVRATQPVVTKPGTLVPKEITPAPVKPTPAPAPILVAKINPEPVIEAPKTVVEPVVTAAAPETNVVPAVILSKATALQLLEKGNSYVSARSKNRVLQIISDRAAADAPPQSWRILYHDDKTTYNAVEVQFHAGEMERVYEPSRLFNFFSSGSSKTLDLAKVKVDSDAAIRVAVAECAGEPVMVKFVELKLERGYGGLPVWNVKLFGVIAGKAAEDAALGYVIVLAEDGKVLKKDITTKSDKPVSKK